MVGLGFVKHDPKRIFDHFVHSSFNIDFYLIWLYLLYQKRSLHPKTQERILEKHGEGFFSWSPYFDTDSEKHLEHLCAIFSRFLYFDIVEEIHIEFDKYIEETDSTAILKEYVLSKKDGIEIIEQDLYYFVRHNSEEILTNTFYIKLNQKNAKAYIDQYMQNWINDDIYDSVILLYSFEKQLSEVQKNIIAGREKFGKRRFEIHTGYDTFTTDENIKINLFANLYYLESKGFIEIHNIDIQAIYFRCKIPRSFTVSITNSGMLYLDQFVYMKKLDTQFSNKSNKIENLNKDSGVFFNEITKELIINGYTKKLFQKQIIFIEGLFDLEGKSTDKWVSLEELAIYDDHIFRNKTEEEKEKIIKNFYNIGNHLNKSIKLETGIEKIFELTTSSIRINPVYF